MLTIANSWYVLNPFVSAVVAYILKMVVTTRSSKAAQKRKADGTTNPRRPSKKQKKSDIPIYEDHNVIAHLESSQAHKERIWRCARSQSNVLQQFTQYDDPHRPQDHNLTETDAILAIASVWKGLEQRNINFSFGDAQFFANSIKSSVVISNHLILPLFFNGESSTPSDSAGTSQKQQNPPLPVLAIASRRNTGRTVRIRFTFFPCTLNGKSTVKTTKDKRQTVPLDQASVEERARAIVKGSSWAVPSKALTVIYDRSKDEWLDDIPAVAHSADADSAAIHVVLNAWAYMLDIPLANGTLIQAEQPNSEFYVNALSLIRLACDGRVDEPTIRGFMQESHYVAAEPTASERRTTTDANELQKLADFKSVFMSTGIFNRVIAYHRETSIKPDAPSAQTIQITHTTPATSTDPAAGTGLAPQSGTVWKEILDQHGNLRDEANKAKHRERDEEMRDDEVSEGVALLWRSLWEQGKRFGFGSNATLQYARSGGQIENEIKAVGRNYDKFVMPLTGYRRTFEVTHAFPNPADPKPQKSHQTGKGRLAKPRDLSMGANGHHVLVIAERDKDEPKNVHLVIMDSRPMTCNAVDIERAAQMVVIRSGWMGLDNVSGEPVPVNPHFTVEHRPVPLQVALNSCGLHVILNAWAYMLDIPIVPKKRRRIGTAGDADFYRYGYAMVQLAYEGSVDSRTIQAFLNHCGYSEEQDATSDDAAVFPLGIEAQSQAELAAYISEKALLWE